MVLLAAISLSTRAMAEDKSSSDTQQTGNAGSELRKAGKHIENAANDAAKTSREKLRKLGQKISEETRPVDQDVKRGVNKLLQKKDRGARPDTAKVEPKTEVAPPAKTP
jgi:Spy/CpxP family protein refolding chaperone